MPEYAILVAPAANRVYAQNAPRLMSREIEVFNQALLGGRLDQHGPTTIGGVDYFAFRADELTDAQLQILSNVSSLHALFERREGLLRPIDVRPIDVFGSDLMTIQKYPGKTNENFTKLLLNVTALSTDQPERFTDRLRVLDPMAGRGTTLNQALTYGWEASGVDVDRRDTEAYVTFLTAWLKNNRVKHRTAQATLRRGRERTGKRTDFWVGLDKDSYKRGDALHLAMTHADTTDCAELFPAAAFDLVLADTPYGVQHGSHRQQLSRRPADLLSAALPGWLTVLRTGGAIGLSYNSYVMKREDILALLADHPVDVLDWGDFTHRVDQAIHRDLVVARKSAPDR